MKIIRINDEMKGTRAGGNRTNCCGGVGGKKSACG